MSSYSLPVSSSSPPIAGNYSTATVQTDKPLLPLAQTSGTGFKGGLKMDCTDFSRRVAMLPHMFEDIRESQRDRRRLHCSISEIAAALTAATTLLQSAGSFDHIISPKKPAVEFISELRSVTCKLEMALANFPYDTFDISDDVIEEIKSVKFQLQRAAQRYETFNNYHQGDESKVRDLANEKLPLKTIDELEDSVIPVDFLCPISYELFRDPVIVSTGQTYERSYINRWINCGKRTCPKTRQQLTNLNLTPNHEMRSLIAQWCTDHNVQPPTLPEKKRPQKHRAAEFIDTVIGATVLLLSISIPIFYGLKH